MKQFLRLLAKNSKRGYFRIEAPADADEATVYLYDVIVNDALEAEWFGGIVPEAFVKEIAAIRAATIHLRINSPGGSAWGASAMTQALRDHPARVIAHIDGVAASAATHVMLAGDEIIMAPQAMLMIHQAWMFLYGNSDELLKAAALMEKYDNLQANAYSKRTKKTDAQMLDMMRAETWFTPEEAIAIGLADSIAEVEPKSAAQANASLGWDLSAFDHAPKPKSQSVPASHRIDVAVFLESLSQRERSIAIA